MAKIQLEGLDDLLADLQLEAERIERNGPAALEKAADVCVDALRKTVPRRYGYLQGSIKPSPIRKGLGGSLDLDVYPQGMKKQSGKSQRFETIGFVLEYGRSNMPTQPWMDPAIESAGESILDALENELMKD